METIEAIKKCTPCFIIDETLLDQNLSVFMKALQDHWNHYIFGYSVKTNSLPYILNHVRQAGCYAEVVSDTEYHLAQASGFSPDHIIFNGLIKSREQFFYAIEHKSIINIDSAREIEWLKEASELGMKAEIGMRVCFDLASLCPDESTRDSFSNHFGFCVENGRFKDAFDQISQLDGITIAGLQMHTNLKARSMNAFRELAKKACQLAEEYQLNLKYVDIGGSFFMNKEDYHVPAQYIQTITEQLRHTFNPEETALIIEPGAAIISTPIQYMTRVIDVKDTYRDHFVITDGGRLHIDPFMRKTQYIYELFTSSESVCKQQVICGFSCMDSDRIIVLNNEPTLSIDDYILYNSVGSYTMCFNSLFIEYFPPVYVKRGEHYEIVREKWDIAEYMQKQIIK